MQATRVEKIMNAPHAGVTSIENITAAETVSQKVADYVSGFRYEDIPKVTRERAKLLVLDAVGIALASTRRESSRSTSAPARR